MYKKWSVLSFALMWMAANVDAGEKLKEGFVDSSGIKIHYVTQGEGPLVVMLHGFPDFWYSWREQIPALAKKYQVVALDLRGYNKSDQPKGVDNYTLPLLVADVEAVRKHFQRDKIIVVGHDWGGLIAWTYAMMHPDHIDRLIVLNLPHPRGLTRELAHNKQQQENSQYARNFQKPGAEKLLTPEMLSAWVNDPEARKKYVEAFGRSSFEGMLNYYKANYPRPPYNQQVAPKEFPPVKCPVLMIHGLKDKYLLPGALNDTWNWVDSDLTLVTVPNAGHFVQQDAADFVTRTMFNWLQMREKQ